MTVRQTYNYEAVNRIANHYVVMLCKDAKNMSVDKCNTMWIDIKKLRDNAGNPDFYADYGWMNTDLAELDSKNWQIVSDFFSAARGYMFVEEYNLDSNLARKDLLVATKRIEKKFPAVVSYNPSKAKPINYEKTIADTVEKAAKYYMQKLAENQQQGLAYVVKLSENINVLRKGKDIKNTDFYMNYRWLKPDMQLNLLDDALYQTLIKFFATVREYIDRRNNKQNMTQVEQELAARVKQINLKIGGALFMPLRNMFWAPSHFLSH